MHHHWIAAPAWALWPKPAAATLTMDGAPEGGGRNLAPRPMETVLAGTGGCTAYDVVLILKRGRHDVRGCQVKLTPSAPRPTRRCSPRSTCTSPSAARMPPRPWNVPSRCRTRSYCSASIMLGKTAEITTDSTSSKSDLQELSMQFFSAICSCCRHLAGRLCLEPRRTEAGRLGR